MRPSCLADMVRSADEVEDEGGSGCVELAVRWDDHFAKLGQALVVRLKLEQFAAVSNALGLEGSVHAVGELVSDEGAQAVGVPEYLVNANLEWDVPFVAALTLTGRVVRTGEQAANIANTMLLDDWTRLDIGARYVAVVAGKPLTFRVNLDNVADADYWASAFDSFRPDLQLGSPRTVKASLTYDFYAAALSIRTVRLR